MGRALEQLARPELWLKPAAQLGAELASVVPRVFVAILLFAAVWLAYRIARRVLIAAVGDREMDPGLRGLLGRALKWSVLGFAFTLAAHQAGIEVTGLLAGFSIAGTAVGFAAEETIANFIAAIAIVWDRPFRVGERIGVGTTIGVVDQITFRSTRLLLGSGEIIVHPNRYMTSSKIVNYASNRQLRVRVPVRIDRDQSIDRTRAVLLALPMGDQRILSDPPPQVIVSGIADGRISLALQFWIDDNLQEGILIQEYIEKAKKAFEEWGVRIPLPRKHAILETPLNLRISEAPTVRALSA